MTKTFSHPHFFRSVLRWLQVGYPEGVPGPDRVALLSLLRSTPLTEEQIGEVVRHFTENGSPAVADRVIDRDEIAEFISEVTHHDAGQRPSGGGQDACHPLDVFRSGVDVGESESGSDRAPASQG